MKALLAACTAILVSVLPLALPLARAAESAPVASPRDTVTLVSDTDTVAAGTQFHVGLRMKLAPGWHTYWRNPGDAGVAPELKLDLPAGMSAGPIAWPTPERIAEGSLMTYAYTGEVLLPVTITPGLTPASFPIEASATWLVCKDICVPEQGRFRLDLTQGSPAPSPQAPLFERATRDSPSPSPWPARIAADGRLWVAGSELNPETVAKAWFIPADAETLDDSAPQPLSVRRGGLVLALKSVKPHVPLSGILTVVDRAGQTTSVTIHATPGPVPKTGGPSLARLLGLAFIGGLILNLMPCVFPVLAMKTIALAESIAHGRRRAHALSYTAGILVTFGALGGALLVARNVGAAAGWGFQFQSPSFVAGMTWLLLAVGLNLSGVFEIGGRLAGTGRGLAGRAGHAGSFFTGLLAVLVATPCTAPFMAAAIAGGLAAPPAMTLLVFVAMGLGLATPYVILAELPGLGRILPRPGRWMELLRQACAFPMYGAAAWLLWVISQEAGPSGVLGTLTGALLVAFAAWVLGASQRSASGSRRLGQSVSAAALLVALSVLTGIAGAPPNPAAALAGPGTEPFTPDRLAALRAAGRPVFVDMTAAWCVTCLVNERVALSKPAVQQAFTENHVAWLLGDWTRQDPAITGFLRQHGRDGVPLYVYFPPGHGTGVVLPQVLTENLVLARVDPSKPN